MLELRNLNNKRFYKGNIGTNVLGCQALITVFDLYQPFNAFVAATEENHKSSCVYLMHLQQSNGMESKEIEGEWGRSHS